MIASRPDFPQARERMVQEEVIGRGVKDPRVVEAMRRVPRHLFVPEALAADAYGGSALPIGWGQSISAPSMVALMTEALQVRPEDKVLEVGTGSGYQAAVLAALAKRVFTVERIPELAREASRRLAELGLGGVVVKVGDGSLGYEEGAPYDRILVAAASPAVPAALAGQLAPGGILVVPVGDRDEQTLVRATKEGEALREERLCRCVFVPLLGRQGFPPPSA